MNEYQLDIHSSYYDGKMSFMHTNQQKNVYIDYSHNKSVSEIDELRSVMVIYLYWLYSLNQSYKYET